MTMPSESMPSESMPRESMPRESTDGSFVDRRNYQVTATPVRERRQFANSHTELTPDARELAIAIDQYKLQHRRRFITFEEMLTVFRSLGYTKA